MPSRSRKTPKSVMFFTIAVANISFMDILEHLRFAGNALFFEKFAAGDDDIFALGIDLEDFEIVGLADELIEVFDALVVDLRAGEECFHADIDHQAAFDLADDFPFDDRAFFAVVDDIFPLALTARFFAGKNDLAVFAFGLIEIDFDFVAEDKFARARENSLMGTSPSDFKPTSTTTKSFVISTMRPLRICPELIDATDPSPAASSFRSSRFLNCLASSSWNSTSSMMLLVVPVVLWLFGHVKGFS